MIEIEGVWKQYKLGNTVDLNRSFREAISQRFRRRQPALSSSENDYFWALKDINLSIQSGRSIGLIGHNGAGKSTLLKVLSRITKPTKGQISMQGSLSSLLEVGTGFHPELSGRENIYLYGSIMGMSRRDLEQKFDAIVDYAGIEQFLETPVKRYSSGMYVRLAFSIAAHVEPDILVVDEVLAVGDKEFREKCLGKMDDVAQSGRTVIFVSHNMNAIASLCQDVAWLDRGQIQQVGDTHTIINAYENSIQNSAPEQRAAALFEGPLKHKLHLKSLRVQDSDEGYSNTIKNTDTIKIEARWHADAVIKKLSVNLGVLTNGTRLMTLCDTDTARDCPKGEFVTRFTIPSNYFRNADLSIAIGGTEHQSNQWCWASDVARIQTVGDGLVAEGDENDALEAIGHGERILSG